MFLRIEFALVEQRLAADERGGLPLVEAQRLAADERGGLPLVEADFKAELPVTGGYDTGGIVGFSIDTDSTDGDNRITACRVSDGTVTGGDNAGGIVGYNVYYSYITSCYTTAGVSGGSSTGAFVGFNNSATITAGYWLTDTQANGVELDTGSSNVTKVEGGVTWKTATDAMNAAIPTDGSCPYRFVQSDGENNPPVLESTGE